MSSATVLVPSHVAASQSITETNSQDVKTSDSPLPVEPTTSQNSVPDQSAPVPAQATPAASKTTPQPLVEAPIAQPAPASQTSPTAPASEQAPQTTPQVTATSPEALPVPASPHATETTEAIAAPATTESTPVPAAAEAPAQDESPAVAKIRNNLRDFAFTKLISMSSKLCFTSTKHCIEQKDGKWVASYKDISPDTLIVQVKPMENNANKYVGIIKYAVLQYEATADTKQLLAQQEFQMIKRLWQTEILRFDGKNWK